jgi:hypothetical protein
MSSRNLAITYSSIFPADKSPLSNYSFEGMMLEALEDVLQDSAKQAIYSNLEKTHNLDKKAIPNKIDEFVEVLEKIFGFGARLIEIEIMKALHRKSGRVLKYFPKTDELSFTEYLMAVKLLNTPSNETDKNP